MFHLRLNHCNGGEKIDSGSLKLQLQHKKGFESPQLQQHLKAVFHIVVLQFQKNKVQCK